MVLIGEFKQAYPDAKVIAVHEAESKTKGLKFDGGEYCSLVCKRHEADYTNPAWGKDAPDTKYGFEDEVSTIPLLLESFS